MRILVHDYAGHAFPIQLSRELATRGYQVTHAFAGGLLTPRGPLEKRECDPVDFDVTEVPMSPDYRANKYKFFKRRGYELSYGDELITLVRRLRPEVIISGNTPTEAQFKMIRQAQSQDTPFISWVQDFYSLAVDRLARRKLPLFGPLVGAWYRHLDRRCLKASASVVAITKDFVPTLTEFGVLAPKITVIPNWAPLDELPLTAKRNSWSIRHGLEGKFVFLYSGTLAMKHNPDLLWQLTLAFRRNLDVRVVVISEGPGADYLRGKQASEGASGLMLLPFQQFSDMPAVLASASVLLTVLEREAGVFSVPSKVLTYHAAGRPILGAMPSENLATQIVREEKSGLCVEPEDAVGFISAAQKLHQDASIRTAMGLRARKYAEREFDMRRIADRFEAVIAKAVTSY